MKTAQEIKKLSGWKGDARLYKLSEPLDGHQFVVVSAVRALYGGPETYIFPANRDGKILDYGEMAGSFRGGMDHAQALSSAGYEITP